MLIFMEIYNSIQIFACIQYRIDILSNITNQFQKLPHKLTYFDMYRFQEPNHLSEKFYVCPFNKSLSKVEVNWIKNDKTNFTKIFV